MLQLYLTDIFAMPYKIKIIECNLVPILHHEIPGKKEKK